jgi:hypothetical protein
MAMKGRCLMKSVQNLFKYDSASSGPGCIEGSSIGNCKLISVDPEEEEDARVD